MLWFIETLSLVILGVGAGFIGFWSKSKNKPAQYFISSVGLVSIGGSLLAYTCHPTLWWSVLFGWGIALFAWIVTMYLKTYF